MGGGIIFVQTIRQVAKYVDVLKGLGFSVDAHHSQMSYVYACLF
jgi:superfamily II DNA/RNA helicase